MFFAIIRFSLLLTMKMISKFFYRFDVSWSVHDPKRLDFEKVRLMALINHTSLFEPVFLGSFPNGLLWEISKRFVYPIAQETLERPVIGPIFKTLSPQTVGLTRQRDHTWSEFVSYVDSRSLIGIAPEGRMKRLNGLDRQGRPMNVRSGIADLIQGLDQGLLIVLYSGGLHHVQSPGSGLPKLFRKIKAHFELINIREYKKNCQELAEQSGVSFARYVVGDLESRRETYCK